MKAARKNSSLEDKIGKVFLIEDSHCEKVLVILGSVREINFFKNGLELNVEFSNNIKAINGFDFFMMKSLVILVDVESTLINLYKWSIEFLQKFNLDISLDILSRLKVADTSNEINGHCKKFNSEEKSNKNSDSLENLSSALRKISTNENSNNSNYNSAEKKRFNIINSKRNISLPPSFKNSNFNYNTLNDEEKSNLNCVFKQFKEQTYYDYLDKSKNKNKKYEECDRVNTCSNYKLNAIKYSINELLDIYNREKPQVNVFFDEKIENNEKFIEEIMLPDNINKKVAHLRMIQRRKTTVCKSLLKFSTESFNKSFFYKSKKSLNNQNIHSKLSTYETLQEEQSKSRLETEVEIENKYDFFSRQRAMTYSQIDPHQFKKKLNSNNKKSGFTFSKKY